MSGHRITSAIQVTVFEPHRHTHVAIVGTGEPEDRKWTLPQLFAAMDAGDTFYTCASNGDAPALTERYICEHCGYETIRSVPGVPDHCNLDTLPKFKKG